MFNFSFFDVSVSHICDAFANTGHLLHAATFFINHVICSILCQHYAVSLEMRADSTFSIIITTLFDTDFKALI